MSIIDKIKGEEDTRIAFMFGFGVVVPVLTILGFYAGTVINKTEIAGQKTWFFDYQMVDLLAGLKGGAVGFVIASIIATYIVVRYPQTVYEDLEKELGHH